MSRILIDYQFANQVGSRLEGFKQIRDRLWNCRCPMCGDGANKKKKRFYIYQSSKNGIKDYLSVTCHNCGYHNTFSRWLEEYDQGMYAEYRMVLFKEMGWGSNRRQYEHPTVEPKEDRPPEPVENSLEEPPAKSRQLTIPTISELPEGHFAREYVAGRCLPAWTYDYLHYSNDFKKHFSGFSSFTDETNINLPSDPRLIIPFYDEWGQLTAVQGRALGDSKLRYITLKKEESSSKVFGLDRVNKTKPVLVVEGPIDSMFLPNCIATADSDLTSAPIGDVFIFDAQYRNAEICEKIDRAIKKGKRVCLFPKGFPYKDINDAVKDGGMKPIDLVRLIGQRTFSGLRAQVEFNELRKDVQYAKRKFR